MLAVLLPATTSFLTRLFLLDVGVLVPPTGTWTPPLPCWRTCPTDTQPTPPTWGLGCGRLAYDRVGVYEARLGRRISDPARVAARRPCGLRIPPGRTPCCCRAGVTSPKGRPQVWSGICRGVPESFAGCRSAVVAVAAVSLALDTTLRSNHALTPPFNVFLHSEWEIHGPASPSSPISLTSASSRQTYKRRLGPTEVSYYLGSRGEGVESGVNDMCVHFISPRPPLQTDRPVLRYLHIGELASRCKCRKRSATLTQLNWMQDSRLKYHL